MPLYDAEVFLRELAQYLEANNLGTPGSNLWTGRFPSGKEDGTVITLTGGPKSPGEPVQLRRFQVLNRSKAFGAGLVAHQAIYRALAGANGKWNTLPSFPGRIYATSEVGVNWQEEGTGYVFHSLNFIYEATGG